jgi:molybdenum cofactor biosynthesis enzyme MoaA
MQPIRFDQHKFPVKQLQGKYCITPFILISIAESGQVYLCGCTWWMSQPVGNILQSTLDEILSSDTAKNIRQSIIDGSYVYCNEKVCGVMANDGLNTIDTLPPNVAMLVTDSNKYNLPYHIHLSLDQTCNLSCPSCRTQVIKVPDEQKQQQREIGRTILKNLFSTPTDQKMIIEISAGGELFSSEMLMEMLSGIEVDRFPNLEIHIGTNATLITKRWSRIQSVEKFVKKITVSIDAGSPEVYEVVRRGGKWKDLCNGMDFLKEKKKSIKFELNGRLIFQQANYKDSQKFYDLCQSWNCDLAEFSRIYNWNTWTKSVFDQHDVYNSNHTEFEQAKAIIDRMKANPKTWFNGF